MKKTLLLLSLLTLLLAPAPRPGVRAERPQPGGHFEKDDLSFDYPAGWSLLDRSNETAQHLILSREGSSALITVVAYRGAVTDAAQFYKAREAVTTPYVQELARGLGVEKVPAWADAKCVDVGEPLPAGQRLGYGFRLSGESQGGPSTAEVYAALLGRRFVNLAYLRSDKDDAEAAPAWRRVLRTIKVGGPPGPLLGAPSVVSGGVLDGRVVSKPPPSGYPAAAKAARQEGAVTVQVTVDEAGNVLSAKAVAGAESLREVSERAAMKAKFKPAKVCDHPVKVSGVVTYNFVLQ